jgi:hypothetical protein
LPLPLSAWAQRHIHSLNRLSGVRQKSSADQLMRERAVTNGYGTAGRRSAGGGSQFHRTQDGAIALNLSREDDRTLLPALFETADVEDLAACCAHAMESRLVARGRTMGLAIAGLHEQPVSHALDVRVLGERKAPRPMPRVLDLSALWAGPLASRLLQDAGCAVTRVDSVSRPDAMEHADPAHFQALNDGKRRVQVDLRSGEGLRQLRALIAQSDIVIEAARPRALLQLDIDADAMIRAQPGLTWTTITGHGTAKGAGDWVAFGDDAAVAGGLSREMFETTGRLAFVGDAIADPLTGIRAAETAYRHHCDGGGVRLTLSMSGLVALAIRSEKARSPAQWQALLRAWSCRTGEPIGRLKADGQMAPSC